MKQIRSGEANDYRDLTYRFRAEPGPWTGWQDDWTAAKKLVAQMTLDEKVALVSAPMAADGALEGSHGSAAATPGVPRLGIPMWDESDASMGVTNPNNVRGQEDVTAFPALIALGATFCKRRSARGG